MKILGNMLIALVVATGITLFTIWALNVNEKTECEYWTIQATKVSNYYFTQWQADQCKAHGIIINAPIK